MRRINGVIAFTQENFDLVFEALEELVKLQSHYAKLLNMHDGGKRHSFTSADEWIQRVKDLKR